MRIRTRGYAAAVGLAVLALVATACGGSSGSPSTGSSSGSGSQAFGLQGVNPGTGTPQKGGTLNMLGQGDVDFMDYNVSYYTIGALGQRPWLRLLYAYPATPGKTTTVVPDLATALPTVSNGGKTYTVTIRSGADWDSSPARQVTAADALLGLKRSCNPTQPFGGLPDFEALIVGYQTFCNGFAKVSSSSVSAIKNYIDTHQISGVKASGLTITYNLVHPASYFPDMLQLDAFAPAPVESLNYLVGSSADAQHIIANGPYKIQSYVPARSIIFVRNPAWKASTDPIRKAYVNEMKITETGNEPAIQQQLQTNTAAASMEFDAFPPVGADPGLEAQMKQGLNHNFNLGSTYSTNPYIVFNAVSPNNNAALSKVAVRQALSYGIDRAHLLTDNGGPTQGVALTHVLPAGINGAQDVPSGYNPYPVQPDQGQADAGRGGVQERAERDPALPAGQHGREQDGADAAERPDQDRREGQAAVGHPLGLLREVHGGAERGQARRLGPVPRRMGPGLVRGRGGLVLQPAVLRPGLLPAPGQQLRVLQQPVGDRPDRQGCQRGVGQLRPPPSGPRRTRRS